MQGKRILNLIRENEADNELKKQIGMIFNIEALIKSEGKFLVRKTIKDATVTLQDDLGSINKRNSFKFDMTIDKANSFKRKNTMS